MGSNATEDLPGLVFPHIQAQAQQLGGALHGLTSGDECNAQIHFAEVLHPNDALDGCPPWDQGAWGRSTRFRDNARGRLKQLVHQERVHALHEMLINTDLVSLSQQGLSTVEVQWSNL